MGRHSASGLLRFGALFLPVFLAVAVHTACSPAEEKDPLSAAPDITTPCAPYCPEMACGYTTCGQWCDNCPAGYACMEQECVSLGWTGDVGSSDVMVGPASDVAGTDTAGGSDATTTAPDTAPDIPQGTPEDGDGDGFADGEDNCPTDYNPSQADFENDGLGDLCDPDDDNDGDTDDVDCDYHNPGINSLATEACDGIDNDCDGALDEPESIGCFPAYQDADYDGHGSGDSPLCVCNFPTPGASLLMDDCDDTNAQINPDAMEVCDGKDNNCNGEWDEGEAAGCVIAYQDLDGDGYGNLAASFCVCEPLEDGLSPLPGDCDDSNPSIQPIMLENCDDFDNNCDGQVDEQCNVDGDGYCTSYMGVSGTPAVCPSGGGDCDDTNAEVNPGMVEKGFDGLDNDCNGVIDGVGGEFEPDCAGQQCTGHTVDAYLCSLDVCYDDLLVSAAFSSPSGASIDPAWQAVSHFGNAWNDLAPWAGNSYALLAAGQATGTSHSGGLGGFSVADPYAKDGYQTYDNVEFTMVLHAPLGALGFSIDYIFFSEEYEEYIGSSFNDKFYIFLTAPVTTQGQKIVVNHTACSNPNAYFDFVDGEGNKQCYVAINTAFSEPCSNPATNISGTGYECGPGGSSAGSSTGWLSTSWPIEAEETFTLTFHIHDASDQIYDSEVILDNFKWLGEPFDPGTVIHSNNP
jgi:hypothetical protein